MTNHGRVPELMEGTMKQQVFEIGGMTCGHCVSRVGNALRALPAVTVDRVKVGEATVTFDESTIEAEAIGQTIEDAGYDVLQAK
jgi:copper chaperone